MGDRPLLAVWKLASCDGCQLTLLDCEDELLAVADAVEIGFFAEATSRVVEGPYDVSLVEGSITTDEDARRIREIREQSRVLVTIGACATAGGIQALRNFADVEEYRRVVYASTAFAETLATSTPVAAHVRVDHELRGCPIDRDQLLELLTALLAGRRPQIPTGDVCLACKRSGRVCVMVAQGVPCLGPVTRAGCGALCPSFARGCFGCFGPAETTNTGPLIDAWRALDVDDATISRAFRTFNCGAPAFRDASLDVEGASGPPTGEGDEEGP